MFDRDLSPRGEARAPAASDSSDSFHEFLLTRTASTTSDRRAALLAAAKVRRARAFRLVAGLGFFSGGALLGSAATLLAQGRPPLWPAGVLSGSGLAVACTSLLALRRIRLGPLSAPTAPA